MKYITLLLFLMILAACSDVENSTKEKVFLVDSVKTSKIQGMLDTALPKLLSACPGLNTFASELTDVRAFPSRMIGFEGGVELSFVINKNSGVLPAPLNIRSGGHNCSISINSEQTIAYMAKRACHSICSGVWQENDPDSMGRKFEI